MRLNDLELRLKMAVLEVCGAHCPPRSDIHKMLPLHSKADVDNCLTFLVNEKLIEHVAEGDRFKSTEEGYAQAQSWESKKAEVAARRPMGLVKTVVGKVLDSFKGGKSAPFASDEARRMLSTVAAHRTKGGIEWDLKQVEEKIAKVAGSASNVEMDALIATRARLIVLLAAFDDDHGRRMPAALTALFPIARYLLETEFPPELARCIEDASVATSNRERIARDNRKRIAELTAEIVAAEQLEDAANRQRTQLLDSPASLLLDALTVAGIFHDPREIRQAVDEVRGQIARESAPAEATAAALALGFSTAGSGRTVSRDDNFKEIFKRS